MKTNLQPFVICVLLILSSTQGYAQDVIAPPALGEDTKGTPAQIVTTEKPITNDDQPSTTDDSQQVNNKPNFFDSPKVTESRRESGQVYRIELEHAIGSKQVIEENDSDGNIETTPNDIEDTPNLPKWRLGSW